MGVTGTIYSLRFRGTAASDHSLRPQREPEIKSNVFGKTACHLQNTFHQERSGLIKGMARSLHVGTNATCSKVRGNRGSQ